MKTISSVIFERQELRRKERPSCEPFSKDFHVSLRRVCWRLGRLFSSIFLNLSWTCVKLILLFNLNRLYWGCRLLANDIHFLNIFGSFYPHLLRCDIYRFWHLDLRNYVIQALFKLIHSVLRVQVQFWVYPHWVLILPIRWRIHDTFSSLR